MKTISLKLDAVFAALAVAVLAVVALSPAIVNAGTYAGTNGKITFASPSGVQVVNSDGTGAVTIDNTDALSGNPRLSPDGTKVVWTQYEGGAPTNYANVRVANSDGTGSITDITTGTTARHDGATWSPDGLWLVYTEDTSLDAELGGSIQIESATGGTPTQLINAVPCTGGAADTDGWEQPNWSNDGSKIAVINRCDEVNGGIYYFNTVGYTPGSATAPTVDLPNAVHFTDDNTATVVDYWPSFSPDSTNIIFTRVNAGNYSIQRAANGALPALTQVYDATTNFVATAVYSPDGASIAFNLGTTGVNTIPAAGGTPTLVANTANATSADWGVAVAVPPVVDPGAGPAAPGAADPNAPGTPNTGIALLFANPLLTLIASTFSAGGLALLARRFGMIK